MKILVITEEDEFYLPLSIDYLLKNCEMQIVEVVCAKNPLVTGSLKAACVFYKAFGIVPIISHGLRTIKAKLLNIFDFLNYSGRFYSVKNVCKKNKVKYSYCENINSKEFLQHCRYLEIDLIASVSPTQIFKDDLINLPKYGCINIHTAKLPNYRGLYPTYWAMACGEKQIGISIHYIEKGIDTGKIIIQDELEIVPGTTLDHMLTITKQRGVQLLIEAINGISSDTIAPFYAEGEGTYFSFPTAESYKKFKNQGYRL